MEDGHEGLMKDWAASPRHSGQCFIRDGIIDADRWSRAPRKLLFVLREAYGDATDTEGWDLRVAIREEWDGPKYKIWWTVAYWAYALHRASADRLPPLPVDDSAFAAAREALLSSAAINIKKSGGKSSSDLDDLASYVNSDGRYILRQIDLIAPEILICGNVWSLIRGLWPDARQVYDRVWVAGGRTVVDFWHPANQFPNGLNYYALAALLQNSGVLQECPTGDAS